MTTRIPPPATPARKKLLSRIAVAQRQADAAKRTAKLAKLGLRAAKDKSKSAKRAAKKLRKAVKALKVELAGLGTAKTRRKRVGRKAVTKRSKPAPVAAITPGPVVGEPASVAPAAPAAQ